MYRLALEIQKKITQLLMSISLNYIYVPLDVMYACN